MYSYDRRASVKVSVDLRSVLDRPAKADEALTLAYQSLMTFKQGLDSLDELPNGFERVYRTVLDAVNSVAEAKKDTYDLRLMTRRMGN